MFYTQLSSPLGLLTLLSDDGKLSGLYMENQRYFPSLEGYVRQDDLPVFKEAEHWLSCYFQGGILPPMPQLLIKGTSFQKAVWALLLEIPYGETVTYCQLARRLRPEGPVSAQAVGGAVGKNPISVLIPCHRVVGANNALTGYAGGIERKAYLLSIEQKKSTF